MGWGKDSSPDRAEGAEEVLGLGTPHQNDLRCGQRREAACVGSNRDLAGALREKVVPGTETAWKVSSRQDSVLIKD